MHNINYLQGGLPVLTVAERESYLAEESVRQAVGLFSETGDGAQLAQNILSLYQSPEMCGKMSKNALMLYTGRYAKSVGLARYAALFEDIFPSAN